MVINHKDFTKMRVEHHVQSKLYCNNLQTGRALVATITSLITWPHNDPVVSKYMVCATFSSYTRLLRLFMFQLSLYSTGVAWWYETLRWRCCWECPWR